VVGGGLSMRKGAVCYIVFHLEGKFVTRSRIKTTVLSVAVCLCVVWETKLLAVGRSSIKQ